MVVVNAVAPPAGFGCITTSKTKAIRFIKQATARGCDKNVSRQLLLHIADDSASTEVDDAD
jgi:hypothetical protein